MADTEVGPGFIGLAELLASLIRETGEAVHSAQLAQTENECELKAAASLDVEAAAEMLVTEEAAEAILQQLLSEAGADSAWERRYEIFLKLVETRYGFGLASTGDYTKSGLTAQGRTKILSAARRNAAMEQLEVVHRLLGGGTHRVKVASGTISVKLEMRVHANVASKTKEAGKTSAGAQKPEIAPSLLSAVSRDSGLRILVRPAQNEDGERAGIFGELKINFAIV